MVSKRKTDGEGFVFGVCTFGGKKEKKRKERKTYSLALCVPRAGRNQLWLKQAAADDVSNIVGASSEHDGLGAQSSRADFGDQHVDDGPHGHGVGAQPDDAQDRLGPGEFEVLLGQGQEPDQPEQHDQEREPE